MHMSANAASCFRQVRLSEAGAALAERDEVISRLQAAAAVRCRSAAAVPRMALPIDTTSSGMLALRGQSAAWQGLQLQLDFIGAITSQQLA